MEPYCFTTSNLILLLRKCNNVIGIFIFVTTVACVVPIIATELVVNVKNQVNTILSAFEIVKLFIFS